MIAIRLRKPLNYYDRETVTHWRALGREGLPPPTLTVPARTTLTIVDFPTANFDALAFTPDGKRIFVSRKTLRAHGYKPRAAATQEDA